MTRQIWVLALTGLAAPAFAQSPASNTPQSTDVSAPVADAARDDRIALADQRTTIVVTGSRISQLGVADSANEGVVTGKQLEARTVYRPGELLEATPGLIVSQHSGEGKANQFYLRGFNLDHGTDLRTTVDGMLVNQRSHSHGQGWTDVNFLIPELADRLTYRKGPYSAEDGDFAAAGSVSVSYVDKLPKTLISLGVGENGYRRGLIAGSPAVAGGNLLYALELFHNDGPFTKGDNYRKINGVLRYSRGDDRSGFNVTAMGYQATYNATDQIPSARSMPGRSTASARSIRPTAARFTVTACRRRGIRSETTARRRSAPTSPTTACVSIPTSLTFWTTPSMAISSGNPTIAPAPRSTPATRSAARCSGVSPRPHSASSSSAMRSATG